MANNLSWAEFKKRFDGNLQHVYTRIKNDRSFRLIEPDSSVARLRGQMADGVTFFPTGLLIVLPKPSRKTGNLTRAELDFERVIYPKKYNTYKAFLSAVRKYIITGAERTSPTEFPVRMFLVKGTTYVEFSKLEKEADFGGKPRDGEKRNVYFGRLEEYVDKVDSSYKLNIPSPTEQGEADFIDDVNRAITDILEENNIPSLTLKIGNDTFDNIVGINKVAGNVKADLAFVALNGKKLVDVGFYSHKKGYRAKDFGQWAGTTFLYHHDAVKGFVDYMHTVVGPNKLYDLSKMGPTTFGMIMEGASLRPIRMSAIYGKEWNTSQRGPSNCHGLLQGHPRINKVGSNYVLTMTGHYEKNGDEVSGDYFPAMMLIKKASSENIAVGVGRADTGGKPNGGIPGGRFSIYPMGGRTITHVVECKGNKWNDPTAWSCHP
jgi:hypothetical protein